MRGLARVCGAACLGLYRLIVRARAKAFSLAISGAFDSFGRRTVIELPVRLHGERRIALGSDVFVGAGSWLQAVGDGRLEVGDGTSIAGGCILSAASSVRLGRKVLVARNVYVSDHIHAYVDTERAVLEQGLTHLDAVVREDVPDHALAVGIPAHVVSRFAPLPAAAAGASF